MEKIQWQPKYAEQMEQTERESTYTEHNGGNDRTEQAEWQPKYAKQYAEQTEGIWNRLKS